MIFWLKKVLVTAEKTNKEKKTEKEKNKNKKGENRHSLLCITLKAPRVFTNPPNHAHRGVLESNELHIAQVQHGAENLKHGGLQHQARKVIK